MDFANNWVREVTLAPGVTSLAVDLPDGSYLLTCSDFVGAGATRWEVIAAEVVTGTATLTRAQEGTTDQDWPAGSVIYISITAGQMAEIYQAISTPAGGDTARYYTGTALDLSGGIPANLLWMLVDGGLSQLGITLPAVAGAGPGSGTIVSGDAMSINRFTLLVNGNPGAGFSRIKITGPIGTKTFCNVPATTTDSGRSAVIDVGAYTRIEVEQLSDRVLLTLAALNAPAEPVFE